MIFQKKKQLRNEWVGGCLRLFSLLPVSYATDKSFWPENSFTSPKIADDEEEEIDDDEDNDDDNDDDDDDDDEDRYDKRIMLGVPTTKAFFHLAFG